MPIDDTTAIEEWTRAQARVLELAGGLSDADAGRPVPACPAWTVHDLLAHVIGLDADVLAGDEPDDHNATWTQAQVDARVGRGVPVLLAEWRAMTGPVQEWMAAHGTRPMGDVVIHEQDLRGALGVPGARDTAGLAALRERFAGRVTAAVEDAGLPPLALVGEHWRTGPDDAAVVVQASDFDLARAVQSRRSAAQLRGWTTRGDIGPYLPCFAVLGTLPEADLTD